MQHPRRPAPLAALLAIPLVLVLLAGCSSQAPNGDGPGPATEGDPTSARLLQPLSNALPETIEQVHWANGTFSAQEPCNPVGCAMGPASWQRRTDLTPALPPDAPVQVELVLDYASHVLFGHSFQVTLEAADSVVYDHSLVDANGHATLVATLLPRGEVVAVVSAYHSGGEAPATPYALRIRIVASSDLVPPGVPVGVVLDGGDTLQVGGDGEGRGFVLFGPDGARLGAFEERVTLDAAARGGEHAVLLAPGASSVLASDHLHGDGSPGTWRPLGLRHEAGPVATVAQQGVMEEAWEITGTPVGVGLRVFMQPGATGFYNFVTLDLTARVDGPGGVVLDVGVCSSCITLGPITDEFRWATPLGDERIAPGTYTVHTESTVTYEAFVEGYAIYVDFAG